MDPSLLMMLSNLLQLHGCLDHALPTSSSLTADPYSTSAAPLLFFMIASVLSYAAAQSHSPSSSSPTSASTTTTTTTTNTNTTVGMNPNSSSDRSIDAFRTLMTDEIWLMDPQTRDAQWRSAYGLSYSVFVSLVEQLKPHLQKALTVPELSIPADYAVAIVLSRLAHGHSPKAMAAHYKMKPYVISKLTNTVTRVLSTKLYANYVRIPVGHRLLETIHAFRELTGLPNVSGAIDGSHVKLARATEARIADGSFRCRYGFSSILLQVVSDHRKIFWDVCVKAPGASDDATHFRDSSLYNRLTSGEILRDSVITVRGHHVRPYIIGDWCFPLLSSLLTPFTSNSTGTLAQNFFDASLMKGRSTVEQSIGLLKGRWRILQDLNVGIDHAPQTIVACCVLHNICQSSGEPDPVVYKEPKESGTPARPLDSEKSLYYFGESLRQAIADEIQERQQRHPSR